MSLCAALLLSGCNFTAPTPVAYVSHGLAHGHPINPIAALPVRCNASSMGCLPGYQLMVASSSRMALELGGGILVDSELINAELQLRVTRTRQVRRELDGKPVPDPTHDQGGTALPTDQIEQETALTGQTWLQLPLLEQRRLLQDMGINGVLSATVSLGIPHGMAGQRTVTVEVSLRRMSDDALAWQSACSAETGDFHSEPQAVELATRCALESATLW